jgi:hypothetical protein
MPQSYDNIYQIRKTISMAQKTVDKPEHKDFAYLVGSNPQISRTIGLIDIIIKYKDKFKVKESQIEALNFFKDYLITENKALFACLSSELTKLSFFLGKEDDTLSAI